MIAFQVQIILKASITTMVDHEKKKKKNQPCNLKIKTNSGPDYLMDPPIAGSETYDFGWKLDKINKIN